MGNQRIYFTDFKNSLFRDTGVRKAAIILAIGTGVTAYFSDVPLGLLDQASITSRLIKGGLVALPVYIIASIILTIIDMKRKIPIYFKVSISIWILSLLLFLLSLSNYKNGFSNKNSIDMVDIAYNVTIGSTDIVKIEREQTFFPISDIETIVDGVICSPGGVINDAIEVHIYSLDEDSREIVIGNREYDVSSGRLVTETTEPLLKGQKYMKTTTIETIRYCNSFEDNIFIASFECDALDAIIRIDFPDEYGYDTNTLRIEKWHDNGRALIEAESIPDIGNTGNAIRVLINNPKIGDKYGIVWQDATERTCVDGSRTIYVNSNG